MHYELIVETTPGQHVVKFCLLNEHVQHQASNQIALTPPRPLCGKGCLTRAAT